MLLTLKTINDELRRLGHDVHLYFRCDLANSVFN